MTEQTVYSGIIVDNNTELTLVQLSQASGQPAEWVLELVEEGIIEPICRDSVPWSFHGWSLRRVRIARRLEIDLGVNLAGAALALELLEEVEDLRRRMGQM